jgi:hypothetical protein
MKVNEMASGIINVKIIDYQIYITNYMGDKNVKIFSVFPKIGRQKC